MRTWSVALIVSVSANVGLSIILVYVFYDNAYLWSNQQTAWRDLATERHQIQVMRAHFCDASLIPTRTDLLAWEGETRELGSTTEPFEKDGLLWLRNVGVRLDAEARLVGICPYMTWQLLDSPSFGDLDRAGEACPIEPLC